MFTFPELAENVGCPGGVNPVRLITLLGAVVGEAQVAVEFITTEICDPLGNPFAV